MLLLVISEFHFHRNNTIKHPPFTHQKPHVEKAYSLSQLIKPYSSASKGEKAGKPDRLVREDKGG